MDALVRWILRAACVAIALHCAAAQATDGGRCLVEAARQQVGVTLLYDSAYRRIPYPNGDVPIGRGVCTDVLVRAYRAFDIDLQKLVHEDMRRDWDRYPKIWKLNRPDTNIDHRRVPNLQVFFGTHGTREPATRSAELYKAGDIVTWRLDSGVPHIGLVSDRRSPEGTPLVIHNIGFGTVEEDALFGHELTGHYRYLPQALGARCAAAPAH